MNATAGRDPADVDALVQRVNDHLGGGGILGDLFDYNERDYEAVYALGHGFYAQARYFDALKAFGFLVMNNPLERRYVNAYASCQQMRKQYDDALAFYALATVMDIADPRPVFHSAECLIALGRIDEALDALGIVIAQSEAPQQQALKSRAQALHDLLKSPQKTNGGAQ